MSFSDVLRIDRVLTFAQGAEGGNPNNLLLYWLPLLVLMFYVVVLRPQQAEEKKRRAMLSSLKKNDRVLTSAGIFGTVVSSEPGADRIVLRVDDERGVRMEFTKASVVRLMDSTTDKKADVGKTT